MEFCTFTREEQETWKKLYQRLETSRQRQAHPMFSRGLEVLGITADEIPAMRDVNRRLKEISGWQVVPAEGLVDGGEFFQGLGNREFPIGNFIRDKADLSYTPAPDVFHDLYGHIPFFADEKYARFCEDFGNSAVKYAKTSEQLQQYLRVFWFVVEVPLIKTEEGLRIFGGGILSSFNECNFSLSDESAKYPFDTDVIRQKDYRIDIMQESLFVLSSEDQLYSCLPALEQAVAAQG